MLETTGDLLLMLSLIAFRIFQ